MRHLTITALIGLLALGYTAAWAQQKVVIQPVVKSSTTAAGQPVEFPPSPEISAFTADNPGGGTAAPFHKHPYQRLVYVIEGTLNVEREDGTVQSYQAGSLLIEMRDIWHHPVIKDHVKLLVIDFAPKGESNQIARPQ